MNELNNHGPHPAPSLMVRVGVGLLYFLLIACMAIATIVEKVEGNAFVHDTIYGSWWFIALWALLTVAALAMLVKEKVHKRMAVMLLHVAFMVMLVGALLTHLTAESGTVHLRVDKDVTAFTDSEERVRTLPFTMRLTNFETVTYPGTDAVMDYRCEVEVTRHGRTETMSISMNNIGRADGYRFYQSAYDSDGNGTQLLVAHDPYGIAITYTGYVLLLVSLLWTMFSKQTRIRQLYRAATKPLVVLMLFCLGSVGAKGAELTPVAEDIAHDFGKIVISYNGRLCPVSTAAQEFVTKLCGKPSWNGYTADEVFVGWMIYYTEWEEQRIIRVKSAEVQKMLGISGQWASVRDFYTEDNAYKLLGKVNDTTLPEQVRKAVREADEKIQVVTMFYSSEMLRMFPLASTGQGNGGGRLTWHTPGSTELPLGTPAAEFQFINHAMDYLVKSILVNDVNGAKEMIAKIKLYQREKAGDVLPSATMVGMEVFYNHVLAMRWVVFLSLTLSIILCLVLLSGKLRRYAKPAGVTLGVVLLAYTTMLLALRWAISGHVPMSNGYETMSFMAWATLVITMLTMRRIEVMMAFGPLGASFCMLVSMLAVGSPQITRLMPVLQSPLLSMHVAVIMVAYALLAIITLIAIQSLVLSRRGNAAELMRMTALSQLLLYPAIATLTIGIFIGAVWANVSWGTYWSWDPKETWALITLMIYAVPLHRSMMPASSVRYHTYILLAFLAVLMTYFGVNYFLSGMHSYA